MLVLGGSLRCAGEGPASLRDDFLFDTLKMKVLPGLHLRSILGEESVCFSCNFPPLVDVS